MQTREARGREDGAGGRRRRISERRSSLPGGGAGELGRPRRAIGWGIVTCDVSPYTDPQSQPRGPDQKHV